MKIEAAAICLAATRSYSEETREEESLQMWVGDRPNPANNDAPRRGVTGPLDADTISISAEGLKNQAALRAGKPAAIESTPTAETEDMEAATDEDGEVLDPKLEALRQAVEHLIGHKIRLRHFNPHAASAAPPSEPHQSNADQAQANQERAGWGLSYDYHASYREEETTTFSATGVIQTSDGRQIAFNLDLAMHREYAESTDISIRAGDAKMVDPLVINFGGTAAELSNASFAFDLDNDGSEEQISTLAQGSGFLALDRNGDGVINNGSELFGPASGDGFTDLAALDGDNNGWLDDNDSAFQSLKVWTPDENGGGTLSSLAAYGVGALLLEPVDTQFSLTDSANTTLGQIRQTSIFVRESGSVGTVQEVDLAV